MSQHTPGPWIARKGVDGEEDRWGVNVDGPREWSIAIIENGAPGDTLETEGHNARLIAAAPELLHTLKNLVGLAEMRGGALHEYTAAIQEAQAAIAKAEGRTA